MICSDEDNAAEGNRATLLCAPGRWYRNVGTVVVARADMKPLHVHHIQMLLEFIETAEQWNVNSTYDAAFLERNYHDLCLIKDAPNEKAYAKK